MSGVIIYRGPSQLDGSPIIAIAIKARTKDANEKTGATVMYRACKGRKDYSGGRNHFVSLSELRSEAVRAAFVEACRYIQSGVWRD